MLKTDLPELTQSPARPAPKAPKGRRPGIWFLWVLIPSLLFWAWHSRQEGTAMGGKSKPGFGGGEPLLPVVPVTVEAKNFPIYLDGLGTAQAFNSVTIHVRVDGQLTKINFKEGQEVHEGDLLAEIDPAPFQATLAQAVAKKKQDEAQLANLRIDLARDERLVLVRAVSQQVCDAQKTLVAQAEATIEADNASIQSAQVQLAYTQIYAPINGLIGIRSVDKGNIVHASDTTGLIVIAQVHPISLIFTLPQQYLYEIRQQMARGELPVYALDSDNKPTLGESKLAVIDNQVDTTTGTIRLKANFPNDDLRLWPGQFVNARLLLTTKMNAAVVPAAVIQRGPDGPYAFVIKGEGEKLTVEVRTVKVGKIQGTEALVEDGLKPGERVVMEGQYRLQANSKVKIVNSRNAATSETP